MENIVQKAKDKLKEYEDRHQRILDAAIRLFSATGYLATTTAGIAKEAGVTEKTMFRHFASKELLFEACVLSVGGQMLSLWQAARESNKGDDLGYLKAIASLYTDFVINNPDRSMFLVHLYAYRVIPELDEGFKKSMQEQLNEIEKVFESLQRKDVIRRKTHPRLLAGAFVSQYFNAVFLNEFLGPKLYNPETAMEMTRQFLGVE